MTDTARHRLDSHDPNVNDDFFDRFEALTFDDVVVIPGWSETLPDAVDTTATFAADIELAVPLVSAAMDKVTEARMAVAMARHGGIGVIHRNMSVADQASEVQKVKRSQSGMITDPVTLPPTALLHEAESLMNRFKFSGVPITDDAGHLVGILTNRDIRFCEGTDFDRPVTDFMTTADSPTGLVTAEVGTSLDEARAILQQHRIEKLPLVDGTGLARRPDHREGHPEATRLPECVARRSGPTCAAAAAVGVGADLEERVAALVEMSVDAVSIDTAHGHSANVVKAIERIKGSWPELRRHRRQRRHRGRCRRHSPEGWRRCGEGRRGRRIDLHDTCRVGRRACRSCRRSGTPRDEAKEDRCADHRRRWYHILGRHRQGDRSGFGDRDDRLAPGRHRGVAG